jgi:hypothetical protein
MGQEAGPLDFQESQDIKALFCSPQHVSESKRFIVFSCIPLTPNAFDYYNAFDSLLSFIKERGV